MKIKKEILTVMHETLPCFLVLQVGAKLSARKLTYEHYMISCISYGLPYDWPSHLREQINRTFQFRNADVSMEITLGQFRSGKSG